MFSLNVSGTGLTAKCESFLKEYLVYSGVKSVDLSNNKGIGEVTLGSILNGVEDERC